MKNCPICGKEIGVYYELKFKEPYVHNNSFDGLHIYGAYSSPKKTLCNENNFLHFAFYDSDNNLTDHRLVQLGVENPTTKSPTDEFLEMQNEQDEFEDDSEHLVENDDMPF